MFGKKMTLKDRQEIVINQLYQACCDEWRYMTQELEEIMHFIVNHKSRQQMEEAFGSTFVKLAYLFMDAKNLLSEIEELDNE